MSLNINKTLKSLTAHVRKTKGSGEALHFFVKYIQPIKGYFGLDDNTVSMTVKCPKCDMSAITINIGKINENQFMSNIMECSNCGHILRTNDLINADVIVKEKNHIPFNHGKNYKTLRL